MGKQVKIFSQILRILSGYHLGTYMYQISLQIFLYKKAEPAYYKVRTKRCSGL